MSAIARTHRDKRLQAVCDMASILQEIDISECNGNYQHMVLTAVEETGKRLEDLTIGELLTITRNASKAHQGES